MGHDPAVLLGDHVHAAERVLPVVLREGVVRFGPRGGEEGTQRRDLVGVSASERDAPQVSGYSTNLRKIATAFCPPNPKPLIIAVSTVAARATLGT